MREFEITVSRRWAQTQTFRVRGEAELARVTKLYRADYGLGKYTVRVRLV